RAKWVKTFPDEFWIKLFKLKGIPYDPSSMQKPQYVGHLVNNLVYSRLAPGLKQKLQEKNPRRESGTRKDKHFQWLTEDHGVPELREHLSNVMILMDLFLSDPDPDWEKFEAALDKVKPPYGKSFALALESMD
ncbi:MAG: P63C domain-containing protein, partial [Woeseiaceae bacterium]